MDPLASIREKALAADEDGRRAIIDQLTGLAHELESPEDCMQRLMYEVCDDITHRECPWRCRRRSMTDERFPK